MNDHSPPTHPNPAEKPAPLTGGGAFPTAKSRKRSTFSSLWLLPGLAFVVVCFLGFRWFLARPVMLQITFDQGHSIKPGDSLKFRGIVVGSVSEVGLSADLEHVVVQVALNRRHKAMASSGSRFWIVRPRAGLYGVQGLDTLIGPRYIAVIPGKGDSRSTFVGQEEMPPVDSLSPGGLEIVLQTTKRGSLRPGAPVTYRQVPIGTVLSVGLVDDAVHVDVRARIEPPYVNLVRENTVFWNASGFDFSVGLDGLTFGLESLQTLMAGGISLATPDDPGKPVADGYRFILHERLTKEWLDWAPPLPIGKDLVPPGMSLPQPVRAKLSWTRSTMGGFWTSDNEIRAWGLPVAGGFLAPANVFEVDGGSDISLQIAGNSMSPPSGSRIQHPDLRLAEIKVGGKEWPREKIRHPEAVEDCLAVADPLSSVLPLHPSRLRPATQDRWGISSELSISPEWNGAAVVSRKDGFLVGQIVFQSQGKAFVALMPQKMP